MDYRCLELIAEYDAFHPEHIRKHVNKGRAGRGYTSYLSAILVALCEIDNDVDQTANARIEARGLRDRMDHLETAILTEVWFQILGKYRNLVTLVINKKIFII